MSAQQAALIVKMRSAVDQRLDNMGHTCESSIGSTEICNERIINLLVSIIINLEYLLVGTRS